MSFGEIELNLGYTRERRDFTSLSLSLSILRHLHGRRRRRLTAAARSNNPYRRAGRRRTDGDD